MFIIAAYSRCFVLFLIFIHFFNSPQEFFWSPSSSSATIAFQFFKNLNETLFLKTALAEISSGVTCVTKFQYAEDVYGSLFIAMVLDKMCRFIFFRNSNLPSAQSLKNFGCGAAHEPLLGEIIKVDDACC